MTTVSAFGISDVRLEQRLRYDSFSSMGDFFLADVNARRLKQNMKRLAMFRYFKQQHYDIICLQETHSTK